VIEASTLALENNPNDQNTLNLLFRGVHTIKGGAGFLGLTSIGNLTHSMESLLTLARANKLHLTHKHIDALLLSSDRLAAMIDDSVHSNEVDVQELCRTLDEFVLNANNPILEDELDDKLTTHFFKPNNSSLPQTPDYATVISQNKTFTSDYENTNSTESTLVDEDLIDSFIEETRDYLPQIERCLLALEANQGDISPLNELFRHIHTIKGGASFLGLEKIAKLTHIMEDVLGLAKAAKLLLEGDCLEILLDAHDCLAQLIAQYQHDDIIDIQPLFVQLQAFLEPEPKVTATTQKPIIKPASKPVVAAHPPSAPILEDKTSVVAIESSVKFTPEPLATGQSYDDHTPLNLDAEETIRVHVKRLNKLIDLAGELVLVRNQIFRVTEPLIPQVTGLKVILHNFNRITSEMQEEIMSTRMQPVGVIFNKFPRLIRQLEKDLGKNLNLITEGADVELDKTIIESLTDPVTHIIRNMADHGIEKPEERLKRGKPASGTLLQKAFHESGQVVIQFSDDGAGIDPEFIAAKAVQKNIISAEVAEKMTDKEKMLLIFTAGFSTAETVSAVSGRGIGMDVVKTNIEACGGSIDVNSELGKWTSITMTLPLTMAIIASLIVRVNKCRFAFPQNNLEEMVLLESEDYIKRVIEVQGQRMLSLRGIHLPLISLAESLHIKTSDTIGIDKTLYILIIKSEASRVAIIVDQIVGSEEIVVKPMPEYFKQIKNFSGTSILGDGSIAMIIDVQGFIHSNQLAYYSLQKSSRTITQRVVEPEPQSLLIFDNNTEEHFALALSWIQRIDSLDVRKIQNIAGNEYIEYLGEQVRLIRLENCLSVQKPNNYQENANIIIPKNAQIPVALLINKIIDTRNAVIKLENAAIKTDGILGSMILDGKITLILDLHSILQVGAPDSVEKLVVNLEKAKGKHILLVEDTPFFMRVIKECVISAGYQVTTATNGQEGLETLNSQDFDLVLSDIEMPYMDGREMVKNIRANPRWNKLPVIALTTLNDAQTIAEGKKAGFTDWLVKLDKELVLKTLANYL
jgi:two-component system chemotaxis sensor kinase CheA